jgi:hypothetical protein
MLEYLKKSSLYKGQYTVYMSGVVTKFSQKGLYIAQKVGETEHCWSYIVRLNYFTTYNAAN